VTTLKENLTVRALPRTAAAALFFAGVLCVGPALAMPFNFSEAGQVVNGYQDTFDGTTLNPGWQVFGQNVYSLTGNGWLHVTTANNDPNKLFYTGAAYNNSVQEVLALIHVESFGVNVDGSRCGVATVGNLSDGRGINFLFRDSDPASPHVRLLNDAVAWGTRDSFAWALNTDYWVRMRHAPDSVGGNQDAFGKIWPANDVTPEPAGWDISWDYAGGGYRTGFAGIAAGSLGGTSVFDVDYVLIKASGLPQVQVISPEPGTLALLALGAGFLARRRRRRA
jgi:hypothetical protein